MANLQLKLLSPDRDFFEGEVTEVIFSTPEGRIGIMANHSPMIVSLAECIMEILVDGQWKVAAVSQGFGEISSNLAEFYIDTAEWSDEIDVLRANEALRHAEALLHENISQDEQQRTQAAMSRALARLKAADFRTNGRQ